jgi:hypothetical protein
MSSDADVLPKPTCWELSLEHLVNLFEGPVLDLGEVEVNPYRGNETGWAPDPAFKCVSII